jgi:hypothetical protein
MASVSSSRVVGVLDVCADTMAATIGSGLYSSSSLQNGFGPLTWEGTTAALMGWTPLDGI